MKPPRIARRLLGWSVPGADREDVLENLDDLYTRAVVRRGRWRALLWYWVQAFTFGLRLRLGSPPGWSGSDPERSSGGAGGSGPVAVRAIMGDAWLDVRNAWRGFLRAPRFAAAALLTLTLGIGGATLIWAIVYSTVLRPTGYPEADRLQWVWSSGEQSLTLEQFTSLQPVVREAIELSAFVGRSFAMTAGVEAREVPGVAVSVNHFDVFGLAPVVGRGFNESDALAGAAPVAVISHELWLRQFDGDPTVIGRQVDLFTSAAIPMIPGAFTGRRHTIIGVAPPGYRPVGLHAEVITPLRVDVSDPSYANMGELWLVGRLTAGTTAAAARARIEQAVRSLGPFEGMEEAIAAEAVVPLRDALDGNLKPAMLLSLAGVGLVLLMACVNVANLLLVRTHGRRREYAVRQALGATRGRLARQQFAEVSVLVFTATLVGMWLAHALLPAVVAVLPPGIAPGHIALDTVPLMIAFALMVPTSLLCGAAPVFGQAGRQGVAGSRTGRGGTRGDSRIHHAFVIAQIAFALVLGHAAGQLISSFVRLTGIDTGFSTDDVVTVRLAPASTGYREASARLEFYDRVLARARALPNVETAGAIHFLPIADGGPSVFFRANPSDPETQRAAAYRVITPGYVETLRIGLRRGRLLSETDRVGAPAAGMINESLANELWPGEDPLGRVLYRSNGRSWFTVVGVVSDVRQSALGVPPHPEVYLPLAQSEWASAMTLVLRTATPQATGEAVRSIVRSEDPGVPITRISTMESILRQSVAGPRFYSIVFGAFAAIALLLGGVGVYGVTSFVVARRTDEIGVRLALGATPAGVLRREVGRTLGVVAAGIGVGLAIAVSASRWLDGMLFEASPFDPAVFLAATLIIGVVALAAVVMPARRASRTDPVGALRGM